MTFFKKFNDWTNSKIKKLKWWDISQIKLATIFFTLLIAKYFEILTTWNWWVYVILIIIFCINPYKKIFYFK